MFSVASAHSVVRTLCYLRNLCYLRFPQQRGRNLLPLHLERLTTLWFPRAAIPVSRVRQVTFLAVEVGVNPRAGLVVDILSHLMRRVPITLRIVPERTQRRRERRGRAGVGNRSFEV